LQKKTVTGFSGLVTDFGFDCCCCFKPLTTLFLDAADEADDEDNNADKDEVNRAVFHKIK